jgi:hypothetical protein
MSARIVVKAWKSTRLRFSKDSRKTGSTANKYQPVYFANMWASNTGPPNGVRARDEGTG